MRLLRLVSLAGRWWPNRHLISWQSKLEHPLAFYVRAKWWPPFAAVEFLAPRYHVKITNHGEPVEGLSVQAAAAPYQGTFQDIPQAPGKWRELIPYVSLGPLAAGESRIMHVTIPTGVLDVGTYALRFHVVEITTKGLDPGVKSRGHGIGSVFLGEYLRVEPISTVITLAVAVGTFLTAIATIVVALTT